MRASLQSSLFWDINLKNIDFKKHKSFIIGRILEFGEPADYRWAVSHYGKKEIKESLLKNRRLNKKSKNFWCFIFNINKKQCIRNQSTRKQSAFWKR